MFPDIGMLFLRKTTNIWTIWLYIYLYSLHACWAIEQQRSMFQVFISKQVVNEWIIKMQKIPANFTYISEYV